MPQSGYNGVDAMEILQIEYDADIIHKNPGEFLKSNPTQVNCLGARLNFL